jgi:hypothetical protein
MRNIVAIGVRSMVIVTLTLLGACVQHVSGPLLPSQGQSLANIWPAASPPVCKGQKTTKDYASLTSTLSTKGGTLCFPAFSGFGGSSGYSAANPSVNVTLISSTTNYNHKLPGLGKGTPLFYLQLEFPQATKFAGKAANAYFQSDKFISGKTYSKFDRLVVNGMPRYRSCYGVASNGKFAEGPGLRDGAVPAKTTGLYEVYAGKQSDVVCK